MPMTKEQQDRDWEEMKLGMMEAGDKAGAENLRWRLRKGTLKHADLTPRQLEILDTFPEQSETQTTGSTTMETDKKLLETWLGYSVLQAHLLHLTDYHKEYLIDLLEQKKLPEYICQKGTWFWRIHQTQGKEAAMSVACPEEDSFDKEPAKWTQTEIDRVVRLWNEQMPKEDSKGNEYDPLAFLEIYEN